MSESNKPLKLSVSRDEAKSKLSERIEKGNEIKKLPINSQEDFEAVQKQYGKWNSFNVHLLKTLFTTEELSDEYSPGRRVRFISGHRWPLGDEIRDLHADVDHKIYKIGSIVDRIELIPVSSDISESVMHSSSTKKEVDRSKVFVVHGHDNEAKHEVARFIEKIDLEPVILHEQASSSKTIIEKIETYSDVGFGVVIYTPCDVGAKSSDEPDLKGRARQNVVFEHGFLIGKIGRPNVCSLVKGNVETPNDISGIVYTSMDNANWQLNLAKELRKAGYTIDMNKAIEN